MKEQMDALYVIRIYNTKKLKKTSATEKIFANHVCPKGLYPQYIKNYRD